MKFKELITAHHWLSVKLTLLKLYPDQLTIIDEYKRVFESLQIMEPIDNEEMLIVLTEYESDGEYNDETRPTYVDVSGRKAIPDPNLITAGYALEFVKWDNWLGMHLAPETIKNFSGLEIISHCLYEMTFCGYEEDEIQDQFQAIEKIVEEYKSLTNEEKKQQTISLEELKQKIEKKGGS